MANHLTLTIDSDLREVSILAVAVNAACQHLGLDKSTAGKAELCLVEAVTNVIRHAYKGDPDHSVVVTVSSSKQSLKIQISDTGETMPSNRIEQLIHGTPPSPDEDEHLGSLAEGGRGLQIMHDLMNSIAYTTTGKGNVLTMIKQIPIESVAD
jgi:serine/threonine-protein kinase RsbW